MDVLISSRGMQVTVELEELTREKIGRLDRYLNGLDRATVHFWEEHNPRITEKDACEITLEGRGHHVRCKVVATDGFVAVDRAVAKLERQLRKRKTKLTKQYHHTGGRHDKYSEVKPVLVPDAQDIAIIREKQFVSAPMTAVEAVQEMELLGHDFFLFSNIETGRPAVVYKRFDTDYGLIENTDEA